MSWIDDQRKRLQALALSTGRNVRDIFDANTAADQARRVAKGQPVTYQEQQAQRRAASQQTRPSQMWGGAQQPSGRAETPIQKPAYTVRNLTNNNEQADTRTGLTKFIAQVNPLDAGKTWQQQNMQTKDSALMQAVKGYPKAVAAPFIGLPLRTTRTAIGIGQGVSGLVDLAPGDGVSRISKALDVAAKEVDKTAQKTGSNWIYKPAGPVQEGALYALSGGGLALMKGAALAGKTGQAAKFGSVLNKIDEPVKNITQKALGKGRVGKTVSGAIVTPEVIPDVVGTAKYIGEDTSKGKEITPERLAVDVATGIGGGLVGSIANNILEKFAKKQLFDRLAKESDPEVVGKTIKDANTGLTDEQINKVKGDIAITTDKAEVENIIKNVSEPAQAPTPAVTDDIANTLTATSKPEEVRFVIDNLLPKLPEPAKVALANNVAKSTDTNQIKQLMDEAKLRESQLDETMQANTPAEAVPTTQAEQTQQAMEEAIPAPKPAPESTQAPINQEPTTTAPSGVQGATTADNVPETAAIDATKYDNPTKYLDARIRQIKDKSQQLKDYLRIYKLGSTEAGQNSPEYTKLVDDYKAKYGDTEAPEVTQIMDDFTASRQPVDVTADPVKQTFLGKVFETGKDIFQKTKEQLYDPWIEWDRISNKITKNMGLERKDADPLFNLTDLINKRVTVSQISDRVLLAKNRTGQSVAEVFAKYPDVDVAKGVQDNAFVRYLQSRFFLEVYDKSGGKIWKGQGYTPDDAARSISDFEARNPTARLDADTVKAWADDWVDYKVANNEISAEHGNNLKNAYSVYTPLERAPTPDLISPTFSGGRGGVGTEQIAQNITEVAGNYDTSLASIKNRNLRYTQESTDNDILLALDKAYRNKYIDEADDVYIAIDPEKVEQREAVVSRLEETRAKIDELKKQRNKANRQAKKAKAKLKQAEASAKNIVRSEKQKEYAKTVEKLRAGIDKAKVKLKVQKAKLGLPQYRTQQAETKAVTTARNELLKTVSDTDAKAVISKMTKEDLIDVFQAMADDAPIQAGVWGRLKKLNVTRKQYNKLVDDITGQRQAILIAKQQLTDFIGENRNIGAIGKMSDDEIIDALDIIASKDVKSAADASERLRAKGGFYQELSDQLQATRDELDIKKAEAAGDWAEAARLNQVKPQYENLVPYFKNGYKGYMHVNKNMASEMNSMRTAAKPNLVEKGIRGVSNAQKWVFTGGAAPVFKLVTNPIRNVTQMAVLGRGLSAFGAKPMAAGAKSVFTRAEKDTYTQRLIDYGLRLELSTKSPTARNTGVKELASKTSKAGRLKYLAKNPGELYHTLNSGMAKLDNAARIQVAKGAELNARRRHPDWSEDQIMSFAASEGNNVLGNFNRVSRLARDAEVINNYSGATQTGFRQLMETFRERPIETGTKVMSLVGTVAGITGYMLAGDMSDDYKETMKEYYDQQIASGNTNELDSNIIIGIPGKVKYDEATNTWTGIVKKPLPPDYKPLIRASWRTAYDIASNKPFNPALIGKELANFATADQRGNIRDPKTGVWLPNSPLADLGRLFMGQDQNTGKPLVTEQQSYLPKSEQYNKYTSDLAKFFSKVTKGSLSPIQIDAIFSQSGYFGTKLKSVETEAEKNIGILRSVAKDFTSRVYGSRGYSEKQEKGKKFSEGMESLLRKYKLDENQFDIVQTLFPTNKDKDGKDIKPEGYYVSSIKAQQLANSLMSDGKVWEFAKEASRLSQEPGDPSDPLYDLDKDKAEIVLALMSRADPQSLDKKKIMKDNPWIKEFYTKRGEFFDNLISKKNMDYERDVQAGLMTQEDLDEIKSDAGKDFMGMKIPKMSPELKAKQAELDKLDKGTDAAKRYEFMKNNPDLQEFYDDNSSYNRFKRSVMRLPLFDEYPEASQKVKNIMDEYYALPKDNGPISKYTGEATSPDRSAWFEANPEKAALLTEQWYKQNIFNLQGAAALATYEGESLDESAFDDIKQIADYREKLENGGSGYGKFGYGSGGSKSKKTTEQQIADQLSPNISSFIAGIKPSEFGPISQVNTKPSTTKFKVKLPSGSTKKARIRLQ